MIRPFKAAMITAAMALIHIQVIKAATIFQQNFSSSTTVSDYAAVSPSSGQWNAITSSGAGTTYAITSGALAVSRTANVGAMSRTSDFVPTPTSMTYKFDLSMSGNSAATTSAAVFQVGSGYGTTNAAELIADTYARIAINIGLNPGEFAIRDITNGTNSPTLTGTQSITWVLNNSGATINYIAPGGGAVSVANDTADLYIGATNTATFNDVAIQTTSQTMTDLKFAFTAGVGTITMDNISIESPVPEPTGLLLLAMTGLALARRRRV